MDAYNPSEKLVDFQESRSSGSAGSWANGDHADEATEQAQPATNVTLKLKKARSRVAGLVRKTEEHDVEWQEAKAAEEKGRELLQYMKEQWKVQPTQVGSLMEVSYRTIELMEKKKPPDYWMNRRERELIAEHTGLFSDVRKPYETLGEVDLEADSLMFRNLPSQLKIDSEPWFNMLRNKAEEERKRNAPLPRLPRTRLRRPTFARGRITKGAGGMLAMEKMVRTGEEFQRGIRGSMTYGKMLQNWHDEKEKKDAYRGNEFGIFNQRQKSQEIANPESEVIEEEKSEQTEAAPAVKPKKHARRTRSSMIDDKAVKLEMSNLEKIMMAMYDLIKSMLNIKKAQLKGNVRLPQSVIWSLREHSPESSLRKKKRRPTEAERRAKFGATIYSPFKPRKGSFFAETLDLPPPPPPVIITGDNDCGYDYEGTGRVRPDVLDVEGVANALPMHPASTQEQIGDAVERVRAVVYSNTYLDDRPDNLKVCPILPEAPAATVQRLAKNERRFKSIFEPYSKEEPSMWHNVKVDDLELMEGMTRNEILKKSYSAIDFTKEPDIALLTYTDKIPQIDDVPTPKLPAPPSLVRISSAEHSRLNLLKKIPKSEFEDLPYDIQRLYEEAGVLNREIDLYHIIMKMKTPFRNIEKKIRFFYTNEIEKFEWDTMKRYKIKINAIKPDPVYVWSVGLMRQAMNEPTEDDVVADGEKRAAIWYRSLIERCEAAGALKHIGCEEMLMKLHKYCDVDTQSRPHMLDRFCLLVLSLSPTELGTAHFQDAIAFLLDRLFGTPKELLYHWLNMRGLPYLV